MIHGVTSDGYIVRVEPIWESSSVNDLPGERWRPVAGFEGSYEVSNLGRVKSVEREVMFGNQIRLVPELIRKQNLHASGYLGVNLGLGRRSKAGGASRRFSVHSLVANAWLGQRPDHDFDVDHINGLKIDNRVANLRWQHRSTNRSVTGPVPRRGKPPLPDDEVERLRVRYMHGETVVALARSFDLTTSGVYRIATGRSRAGAPGPVHGRDYFIRMKPAMPADVTRRVA